MKHIWHISSVEYMLIEKSFKRVEKSFNTCWLYRYNMQSEGGSVLLICAANSRSFILNMPTFSFFTWCVIEGLKKVAYDTWENELTVHHWKEKYYQHFLLQNECALTSYHLYLHYSSSFCIPYCCISHLWMYFFQRSTVEINSILSWCLHLHRVDIWNGFHAHKQRYISIINHESSIWFYPMSQFIVNLWNAKNEK